MPVNILKNIQMHSSGGVEYEQKKKMLKQIGLSEFVSISVETTGTNSENLEIIEIAGIKFNDGEISQKLVLTTGQDFENYEILPSFLDFVGDSHIVGYNLEFDISVIENLSNISFPNNKFDVEKLSQICIPRLANHKIETLLEYFDIPFPHKEINGAGQVQLDSKNKILNKAIAVGQIFLHLVEILLSLDFRNLQLIVKLLEPTREPLKRLFNKITDYLSDGKKFKSPKLKNIPKLPNVIGDSIGITSENDMVSLLKEKEIISIFDNGGEIEKSLGNYEKRKEQVEMVKSVTRAFNNSEFLIAEAGTGTGKSLAYLVPAIYWSVVNSDPEINSGGERVVISTNTKNLQEQLFFKDIPLLMNALDIDFKAVLLKGRSNYLCIDKWQSTMIDMNSKFSIPERVKVLPLVIWKDETETGDISENNAFKLENNSGLWQKFIAETGYCTGPKCKFYNDCYLFKARKEARNANIVIVNHSLLFSDLITENAILQDYHNIVFDEAHNIEKTATEFLGFELNVWMFKSVVNGLYSKEGTEIGVLVQLRQRIEFGKIDAYTKKTFSKKIETISELSLNLWKKSQEFFKVLSFSVRDGSASGGEVSSKAKNNFKNDGNYIKKIRYKKDEPVLKQTSSERDSLMDAIIDIRRNVVDIVESMKDLKSGLFEQQEQIYNELFNISQQLEALANVLNFLTSDINDEEYVFWFEVPSRQESMDIRLYSAPLNISKILKEKLYDKLSTAIFTSATITVDESFEYLKSRIGLNLIDKDKVIIKAFGSPFDYSKQVFIAVPNFLPFPTEYNFTDLAIKLMGKILLKHRKGSLVLFTSYEMLTRAYDELKKVLDSENIVLLGQSKDGSRSAMLSQFKEIKDSILFGTDSFWEGVDVPGSALELLIITKLPFDVPTEPVVSAKIEKINDEGGNPFMDFSVPEAVIKFKQGFGRLIRTKTDKGAVIILDNRVSKKQYGKVFLNSLPTETKIYNKEDNFMEDLGKWYGS